MNPPRLVLQFFRWFCRRDMLKYVEGDLLELYHERLAEYGKKKADLRFIIDVLMLFRPSMIQKLEGITQLNQYGMIKSYFMIGWRNLLRTKGYSLINIGGLAVGLAVVMLIGLWIYDEISYDRYHANYKRIARVWVNHHFDGNISSQWSVPYPLAAELRSQFPDFEKVAAASWTYGHFLANGDTQYSKSGTFVEPEFLQLASINLIKGSPNALKDPHSIIVNQTLSKTIFGNEDPIGKTLKLDAAHLVIVTGVFEDFPSNSSFNSTLWLGNMDLYIDQYVRNPRTRSHWGDYSYQAFVLLNAGGNFEASTERIKNIIINKDERADSKPKLFLHPMNRWHLYGNFENGVNAGGEIQFVWLFGVIGSFVLLLACINFMNLSTARSESRAKEIGLRKTIGSNRGQLILQFLTESILVVFISFVVAIVLVILALGIFNEWTGKQIALPFSSIYFWIAGLTFILLTGLIAGSYPAFLLSSFNPVSILKGTFRMGWFSGFSRKALVIVQFIVSVTLVIGTITVYNQIQFARNRPIGYSKEGLITTYGYPFADNAHKPNTYNGLRQELFNTGAVINMGKSSSPTTGLFSFQSDFDWDGRDKGVMPNVGVIWCSHDYGQTIGLEFTDGRDFSHELASDTASIILNQAAVEYMNLEEPVGKVVKYNFAPFTVIGVVSNMLMDSPYAPVGPAVFMIDYIRAGIITMKLNPAMSASEALQAIEPVFKKFRPEITFEAQFVDKQFDLKFNEEEKIGKLATAFTVFAILISCLGMFGLASFVAQQRTREIGIRKVSGATVYNLWSLLSKDFIILVVISCFIASPLAWYSMQVWLEQYTFHTTLSPWVFIAAGTGAVILTLLTVSYHAIKAATANPINSLKSE